MSKKRLPECFGCFGMTDDCYGCAVKDECEEATDDIDEDAEEPD